MIEVVWEGVLAMVRVLEREGLWFSRLLLQNFLSRVVS